MLLFSSFLCIRRLCIRSNFDAHIVEGEKDMKRISQLGGLFVLLFLTAGCGSTIFYDTAPAANGSVYVSGSNNGDAEIWNCPSDKTGECVKVKVVEK